MEVSAEDLAEVCAEMKDGELLAEHGQVTLTDIEYFALEHEMRRRGIPFKSYIDGSDTRSKTKQPLFIALIVGDASLSSAFWGVWFLGHVIFAFLAVIIMSTRSFELAMVYGFSWAIFSIYSIASIWQCAWNVNWKGWGYIVRAIACVHVIFMYIIIGRSVILSGLL